ncbi:MAG TPA: LamG domain-containing protein [Candidatus Saccharimonadales bacterium]|nr:LamG domain-containing protein [Candidatus Saccharimonadales bacterium]
MQPYNPADQDTPTWFRKHRKLVLLALPLLIFFIAGGAYAAINLTAGSPAEHSALTPGINLDQGEKGLIGWWKLNGNLKDSTPYAHNGTAIGSPAPTTDREGTTNGAYSFNGTTDYISVGSNSQFIPANNAPFSFSMWVQPTNLATSYNRSLLSDQAYPNIGIRAGINVNGKFHLWSSEDGGTMNFAGATSLSVNQWYLLTATYDGSTGRVYVNGKLDGSGSGTVLSPANTAIFIGHISGVDYFQGSIADVRLYNRALSQSDITNLYNSYNSQVNLYSPPGSGNGVNLSQGLIGYWPFNGNAKDATPYSNNGIVSGATLTADRFGNANNAYSLNGTSNQIYTSAAGLPQQAITVAAWVYMSSFPAPAAGERFVNNNWATAAGGWLLYAWDGGSGPYVVFGVDDASKSAHNAVCNSASFTLSTWHFIVGTYDGSTAKIYQDGALCHTANLSSQTLNTSGNFGIAAVTGASAVPETIDQVRLYNRALSAAEVQALYNLPD